MSFWSDMSGRERRTFGACFGGWALDGMDFQFYSFVIPSLIAEWHLTRAQAGTLQTTTLLVSAAFPETSRLLARRGLRLQPLDVSELQKAEAGLTCMSLLFAASR